MYFVVFFPNIRKNCIVPSSWINEININWQKFVNNGLNSNQMFSVFYSANAEALDKNGAPNPNFVPTFSNEIKEFPEEGCYFGKILKYFGKLNVCAHTRC